MLPALLARFRQELGGAELQSAPEILFASTGNTKVKDIEFQGLVSVTWAVFDFKTLATLIISAAGLSVS